MSDLLQTIKDQVSKETKLRFKVGDKVIIPSGKIGEITDIEYASNYPYRIVWQDDGSRSYAKDGEFELYEPRKIKGYRLKEECKQYAEALNKITENSLSSIIDTKHGVNFMHGSYVFDKAQEAGVMHWFEPVYEEPEFTAKKGEWVVITDHDSVKQLDVTTGKAYQLTIDFNGGIEFLDDAGEVNGFDKNMIIQWHIKFRKATPLEIQKAKEGETKVITMRCEGGTFEIEVSKKGIYYRTEKAWINWIELKESLRPISVKNGLSCPGQYTFKPTIIDAGCKKGTYVSDWEKVIEEYERICKS